MKRLASAVACFVALVVSVVGLSGCNVQFSPYAAVVNGSEISQSQLNEALSANAADTGYVCTIEAGGTSRVVGAGDGTYNASFSAEVLSILIQDQVIRQEISRLGLSEPASLGPVALAQLEAATSPSSACVATGASIIHAFAPPYRRQVLGFQVDEDVLAAHLANAQLTPGGLGGFESSHKDETTLACISAIIVRTRAEAALLRLQLLRGASFAALARAHSIDTSTAAQGGTVGCLPDSDFRPPLDTIIAALTPGRVSRPIPFSSEWLLLLLTQRRPMTVAQVVSSLLTEEQSKLSRVLDSLIRSAKVEVDSQYGTWEARRSPPRVVANSGPPSDIVPNPRAATGPAKQTSVSQGGDSR